MFTRMLTLISVLVGSSYAALAQQQACTAQEVPVGVISMTGETFRGLIAADFVAQAHNKKPVSIKSVTFDDGPRRILIVLDANKSLTADARKVQGIMVESLLAAARPEDTFAVLPARGPGREVAFTTDHRAVAEVVGWSGGKEGKDPGALDAIMTGIERFGPPQVGDSIVVIAADMEGNHKANPKMVATALEAHHIRMFALALGAVTTKSSVAGGTMTSTTSRGLAWTTPVVGAIVYKGGDDNFFPLTVNSGGLVLGVMNSDSKRGADLNDPHFVQLVQQKARSVARMIDSFYRVQVEPSSGQRLEEWNVDISETIKKQSSPMFVLYPRALGPC